MIISGASNDGNPPFLDDNDNSMLMLMLLQLVHDSLLDSKR